MHVVAQNSEADLAVKRASKRIAREVCELTANLVRVGRGAGRPYEIERQIRELLGWIDQFRNAAGHSPWPELFANGLREDRDAAFVARVYDEDDLLRHHAEESVIRGALQVFASRLLSQRTQIQTGHNEMYDGIIGIAKLREKTMRDSQILRPEPIRSQVRIKSASPKRRKKK